MPAHHGRHRARRRRSARTPAAALTVSVAVLALFTGSSGGAQAAHGDSAAHSGSAAHVGSVADVSAALEATSVALTAAPPMAPVAASRPAPSSAAPKPAPKPKPRGETAAVSRGLKGSQAAASRSATRAKALGPRQTLARTPAARSARTTRAAAQAFPSLTKFTWTGPVHGTRQTSGFGQRWGRMHAGLDFGGPVGTRLKAMSGGIVTYAGRQGGYGNKVEIQHWDGSLVYYGHMASTSVKKGQVVMPGQLIGRLGNSGRSTGPHLHLEVRPGGDPVDPWPWLVERGILPADTPRS